MDREALAKRLMATFVAELDEHVGSLNRDLLALEKDAARADRAELLISVFRAAHSLKGAARAVEVPLIERACHHLEEILAGVRDGRRPLDAELFSLLYQTVDALERAGARLRAAQGLADTPLEALLPHLEAGERPIAARSMQPPPAAPASGAQVVADGPADRPHEARLVRIAAEKLDALLAASGELVVARNRVASRPEDLASLQELVRLSRSECRQVQKSLRQHPTASGQAPALERAVETLQRLEREIDRLSAWMRADSRRIEQVSTTLDEEVRRARMLPFEQACEGFDRLVRDLARGAGKEVDLTIDGGQVELDRAILSRLRDPLRHLVRNAVDHGIEAPAERAAAGKSPRGKVTIRAALRGAQVEIVVADDGRGIDLAALREKLRQKRLAEPADARELARTVFLPGFSTARMVTDVSGRGVGLDVVKSQVEALRGNVDLSFEPGRGVSFTLTAPLTLTVLRALLVEAAGNVFAVPSLNVEQLLRVAPAQIQTVQGREMLLLGGAPLPVTSLAQVLGMESEHRRSRAKMPVMIVAAGERRIGLIVDQFFAEQDVMVKHLGKRIRRVQQLSGATLLPSGRIALVVSVAHLVRTAVATSATDGTAAGAGEAAPSRRKRLLVVDDSLTTRSLEKSILEGAGYDVTVAADGEGAWEILQNQAVDLVVSDVDMPRMDGLALTAAVRGSERFRAVPVVLVTARESAEDKARGAAAGANAYLIKNAFDQRNLLETIGQLL